MFSYSNLGELLTSTDPENIITTHYYDKLERRLRRDHPDAGMTFFITTEVSFKVCTDKEMMVRKFIKE